MRDGQGPTQPQVGHDEHEQAPVDHLISQNTWNEHTMLGMDKDKGEAER